VRAACVHHYGGPGDVSVDDLPEPEPGPGDVVVDVAAAAVNFPDILVAAGQYQLRVEPPFVLGSELAGTVIAIGAKVQDVDIGDRVCATVLVGAFAERVAVPASTVRRLPADLDFVSAAALWVTYSTAFHALRSIGLAAPDEWVVVLGGSGGVGSAAVDLAGRFGCRVLAAAGGPAKLALCSQLGARAVVDYTCEDLGSSIKAATGGGAHLVIDPVGGPQAEIALRALRWGGRFVTVGYASGVIPKIPLNLVLLKGVTVKGLDIGTFARHDPLAARRGDEELERLVERGLRPRVSATYHLEEAAAALSLLASRRSTGKIVLVTDRALVGTLPAAAAPPADPRPGHRGD